MTLLRGAEDLGPTDPPVLQSSVDRDSVCTCGVYAVAFRKSSRKWLYKIFNIKMARKTQRVVINSQAREIIAKVYDFMKKEAINNYAAKLTDARWRSSQAVGVSERTISRILRERKSPASPTTESNPAQTCEVSIETISPQHDIEDSSEHNNEVTTSQSNLPSTITAVPAAIKTPMKKKKADIKKKKIGQMRSKGSQKDYSDLPINIDSQH